MLKEALRAVGIGLALVGIFFLLLISVPVPSYAATNDCGAYVPQAQSDLMSAMASIAAGDFETAAQLVRNAVRGLQRAVSCEAALCRERADRAGCQTYLEAAGDIASEGCKDLLNGNFGDAGAKLGESLASIKLWLDCVDDACGG